MIAVLGTTAGPARAQSSSAESLFAEGHRLYKQGKIAEACEAFEAANRAEPGAGIYLALGGCRRQNQQLASAWSAYKSALARARDVEKRERASAEIAELEPRLSYLTIAVRADQADGLTIERNGVAVDPRLWNRALPVDGGDYVITAHAPGREPWQETVHVPVERGQLTATIPAFAPQARPVLVAEALSRPSSSTPAVGWPMRRKVAFGVGAGAISALAVGSVLGLVAKHDHDQAKELCSGEVEDGCMNPDSANALARSAHNFAIGADVAFAVAGAAAICAGVLWFTGRRETSDATAIAPSVTTNQFTVLVTRSF